MLAAEAVWKASGSHYSRSRFLAEVGDISRFNNPKELQKLAGLALVENSSGKHKGETTISRRGRKRLRYLLFEVAMSLVSKNQEFRELHNYYTTRRLNPLKKMQSLMAIAAKLIRIILLICLCKSSSLLNNKKPFTKKTKGLQLLQKPVKNNNYRTSLFLSLLSAAIHHDKIQHL